MDVWRLACDIHAEGEVAAHSQPDGEQMIVSARAAEVYHHYAPRGHFRPWALLTPGFTFNVYQLRYPTLICAGVQHTSFYDVRTGSLVQTIDVRLRELRDIDVNERHAFVCEADVVRVFSRESGSEVLRIPADATVRCSQHVENPDFVPGDWFITPLSVSLKVDKPSRPHFIASVSKFTYTLWFTHTHISRSPSLQGRPRSRGLIVKRPRPFHSRF
jgi:hypothetical protein